MSIQEYPELAKIARKIRINILKMIFQAGSGHPGGSLSAVEILTWLFFREMNFSPEKINDQRRDRFILSKGHAAPLLYAILAAKGFFPEDDLWRLRKIDSHLQGHPHRLDTPGVEASTGSLGQGLSMAVGVAIGLRISRINASTYCLIGDGESQEGQIWEALLTAAAQRLNKLCVFLDYNNLQIDGRVSEIKDIQPIKDKLQAFRWNVIEIDGHNFTQIESALKSFHQEKERPTIVIAHTIKGKGVSFMEDNVSFHGKALTAEEFEVALKELGNG